MNNNHRTLETSDDSRDFETEQAEAEELTALLVASVAPPVAGDSAEADLDQARISFTPDQLVEIRRTLAQGAVHPPSRGRASPLLVAGIVATAVAVVAFSAVAWLGLPGRAAASAARLESTGADEAELRELELIALRASHQQEISRLEQRIAEIEAGDDPDPGVSVARLSVELEEARAQSYEVEVEAAALDDQRRSRKRSLAGGARFGPMLDPGSVAAVASLDDNPYDGVTSATNLNRTVWGSAEKGPSEVEELIESAIRGPEPRRSSAPAAAVNALPDSGRAELPARPSRDAVRQVLGSVASAVRRCGGEPYDRLVVELAVEGATGRVASARTIDRGHAGTPVGACAAKAVKLARFPKFQRQNVVIKYPFDL